MQKKAKVWYSWIPTNLGEINILFFGKSKDIGEKLQNAKFEKNRFIAKKIDVSFISDTHYFLTRWLNPLSKTTLPTLEEEIFGTVDVEIEEEEKEKKFLGKIDLFYPEYFQANASFELEYNGKIKIYGLSIDPDDKSLWEKDFSDKEEFLDYLAQVIFIIIKTIVHGDNHHHQKIDTAIEVKRGKFDPAHILQTLIQHMKRVEHDVKNMSRCYGFLKARNTIEEMNGYRSYIKTFRSLFLEHPLPKKSPVYAKDPTILDNIIDSCKATVEKWKNIPKHYSSLLSTLLVYIAISISGAILFINLMGKNYSEKPLLQDDLTIYFYVMILLTVLMISHVACPIMSWFFYKYYAFFEYLYHLSAYEKPKRFRDKAIKQMVKYRKAIFYSVVAAIMLF